MSDDDSGLPATTCHNCHDLFTHDIHKVRLHCHVTGQYLFPACNRCNLQLRAKKSKVTGKVTNDYLLPCVFYNLRAERQSARMSKITNYK